MHPIVAEIRQEVQDIFHSLTTDASVLISDVEEEVSSAGPFVGSKIIGGDPV